MELSTEKEKNHGIPGQKRNTLEGEWQPPKRLVAELITMCLVRFYCTVSYEKNLQK